MAVWLERMSRKSGRVPKPPRRLIEEDDVAVDGEVNGRQVEEEEEAVPPLPSSAE